MKRYLSLDIGKKRTGIALVNDETKVATPLLVISKETTLPDFILEVGELITEYEIDELIVGLPINLKGEESFSAIDVKARMSSVEKRLNKVRMNKGMDKVLINFVDERLSTAQAEKALKLADIPAKNRKNIRDAHAAMVIAQSYIDSI
jgi:putative Holliday junction resolvase